MTRVQSWKLLKAMLKAAFTTVLAGVMIAHAQQTEEKNAAPALEGSWIRTDTEGAGAYEGLTRNFKPAVLTPEGQAMMNRGGGRGRGPQLQVEATPHAAGQPYIVRQNSCSFSGGGFGPGGLEFNSVAFHLIQNKEEVLIVRDGVGSRRIFMDGRKLPDPGVRDPSALGHSVGHYEKGQLVIETTDITPGAVTAGGYRTAETHLIERYIPSADGRHLVIRYEWNDPKIYQKPHIYEYTFDRLPANAVAMEDFCDASDPKENWSIVPPEQK
jgi:hypothetical protein